MSRVVSIVMFPKTNEATRKKGIGGIAFDAEFLRDRFFPEMLETVVFRSFATTPSKSNSQIFRGGFSAEESVPPNSIGSTQANASRHSFYKKMTAA